MSRLGPTGLTQLLTDIKTWITTKLGNYVTTDTTQTVTGKKLFTASSIQLDSVTSMYGSTMFIDTSASAPRGEFPAETHRVGRIYIGNGQSYNGAWFIVDPIIDTNRACYRMVTTNPDNTDSTRFSIVWDSTKEGVRRRKNVSQGDLLPSGASTYNLGELGNAWQDAYINKIHGISDYTNLKTNSFNANTTLTHGGSGRRVILAMGTITLTVPAPEEGSWFLIKAVNGLVTLNLASNVTVTGITAGVFSGPIHLQPNESILLCYYSSTTYNATISTIRRSGVVGRTGNVPSENPKHWFKIAENYVTATYRDPFICLRIFEGTTGNTIGTLCAHCRIDNTVGVVATYNCYLQWQDAGSGIDLSKYALTTNETSGTGVTIALWCTLTGGYSSLKFEVVSECGQSDQLGNPEWVLTRRRQADGDLAELSDTDFTKIVYSTLTTLKNDTTGKANNVTGIVAIANGGTGATTRLNAVKALTNESVGTPTHFLAITTNWGKAGYTTVAQAKTVLGITGDMGSHSDSEYVHKTGDESISGVKSFSNNIAINGTYLGTEASGNERTNIYLLANRDTANASGAYIGRFRQNRTQGAMESSDVSYITFDFLENSARYTRCFTMGMTDWDSDKVPQTYYLTSPDGKGSLGTATAAWNKVYANSYYLGSTAFGDIVTHNASEFLTSHQSLDNYVTLNSNQTITAIKTITGGNQGKMVFKNPDYNKGDANESGVIVSRLYFGNGASYDGANAVLSTSVDSSGNSVVELCAINNTANNSSRASLILSYDKSASSRLLKSWGNFLPYVDNTYTLGNSSSVWKECYCNTYYLGTTAFGDIVTHNASEFLTSHQSLSNYVTLDGTQTIAGTKTFSSTISGSISGNAGTATQFSANTTVALTGDATGTSAGSKKGWSIPVTLANSGVTAGTYGPSEDVTGNNNTTISVPQITVDAKGRVTSVTNRTYTSVNTDTNTDTKVTQTVTNNNAWYPLLIANTASASHTGLEPTTETDEVRKAYNINVQARYGFIYARNSYTADNLKGSVAGGNRTSAAFYGSTYDGAIVGGVELGRVDKYGNRYSRLYATNYITDGALAPDGTAVATTFDVGVLADGTKYLNTSAGWYCNVYPTLDNTRTLGTASLKWSNVYATTFTGDLVGNATTATEFSANKDVTLTGDVTGTASSKAGWSVATTLANSGVTAGSYGPATAVSPAHGGTFSVPYVTVDAKGRVTAASTITVTLPADSNTDTKVTQTSTAASSDYPVILGNTANNTATVTEGTRFSKCLYVNARYGNISIKNAYNSANTKGVRDSATTYQNGIVVFKCYDGSEMGRIHSESNKGGYNRTFIQARNYIKDGAINPEGTAVTAVFALDLLDNGSKRVLTDANWGCNIQPDANNSRTLGTSSLRWKACYSNAYYLGTTAFGDIVTHNASEFLTSHQSLSSCVKNVVTNNQTIKSTGITRGTAPSSAQTFGIAFSDNNNKSIGNVYGQYATDKSTYVGLYAYKGTTTSNGDNASVRVGYDASGNAYTYAPTPATADNSTQIATTAFVKAQGYLTSHQSLANYVTTNTDQSISGIKSHSKHISILGDYVGNESSTNGRSCLYLKANRDTDGKSGLYVTKFRQNVAQGSMGNSDVVFLSHDILENETRTNAGFVESYSNWTNNVPGDMSVYSSIATRNLGTSAKPWTNAYITNLNLNGNAFDPASTSGNIGDVVFAGAYYNAITGTSELDLTVSGNALYLAGFDGNTLLWDNPVAFSGTWKLLGPGKPATTGGNGSTKRTGLWKRIA